MNQSKFSLADVLAVSAALVFGFVCFLGANFLNIGKEKVWFINHTIGCILIAVLCAGLLFVTSFVAKLLKRTSHKIKPYFVWEVVLLVFFVLFSVFFATKTSPFTHFFTVIAEKSEIISELKTNITQAENMFASYESYADNRKHQYNNLLIGVVAAERTDPITFDTFGFIPTQQVPGIKQINSKMFAIHADLFPDNYSDSVHRNGTKEVAAKFLQEAKSTTNSLNFIGIVSVVNDIEKNSNEWFNTLVRYSQIKELGESSTDFNKTLSFVDVKTRFTKFESPTLLSIGLAVMAYILMLLPWFVTPRSTKSTYGFRALIHALFSQKQKKTGSDFDIEY